jgi:hypothetical protein
MKKLSSVVIATCFSVSSIAFAGQQSVASFDDMKAACLNPAKFHNQIAPTNIQVSCRDVKMRWLPDAGTSQNLDTFRNITVQVNSDKYTSNAEMSAIPTDPQMVGCPAYKQVLETVETVRSVTCEELLAFNGTAAEFCASAVDSLIAQNPAAINVQDTGKVFNMCAVESPAQQQQQLPIQQAPKKQEQEQKGKKKHHFSIFH